MNHVVLVNLHSLDQYPSNPITSTGPHLTCVLVWRKGNINKKTVSVLYCCKGAQSYEEFLQVGRLYRALILLGLARYHLSTSVSWIFMVLCTCYFLVASFSLPFSELSLVRLALDVVD